MRDKKHSTHSPLPFEKEAYDFTKLPHYDNDFVNEEDIAAFARALATPESPSTDDLLQSPHSTKFITALNDWRPVRQRVRRDDKNRKERKKRSRRGKDETREGYVYTLLKWPLLFIVLAWIVFLGAAYLFTRFYIYSYEHLVTLRGKREQLRKRLQSTRTYDEWLEAAKEMDLYLGNERWKEKDSYDFYNSGTVRAIRDQLKDLRLQLQDMESSPNGVANITGIADELSSLVEAAVKNNFMGTEHPRLYSETFHGTKNLVQSFVDELAMSLEALSTTSAVGAHDKSNMYRHISTNYGRTALCLSGGATFSYYHFGVVKALLDASVLPNVITGTSGGAIIASLVATRTDAELKELLVPALAYRITACHDDWLTWSRRWWSTGARFDSLDWARRSCFFTRGSLTFREAYQRTGRILNVTCIPSDPHSPTVLANYLTAPDCVIWSAVLASAAVPGILNPVVLMKKSRAGTLVPYSFGHKWKDGSLRTDIPLRSLNTYFNVTFSIVSQANPHINLFFFSSRGTVGRPVTHRRGRGWRGGFLGSAIEQYLKLDLTKWLKVLRHLELLPRPLGQDWSEIWLQRFDGTVTIWPKSVVSDFLYILSDPGVDRLARMIRVGELSTFPKLKFIGNRLKVERLIEEGLRRFGAVAGKGDSGTVVENGASQSAGAGVRPSVSSEEEDLEELLHEAEKSHFKAAAKPKRPRIKTRTSPESTGQPAQRPMKQSSSPSLTRRLSDWWTSSPRRSIDERASIRANEAEVTKGQPRRSSVIEELGRQSRVFFDDDTGPDEGESEVDTGSAVESLAGADDKSEDDVMAMNGGQS